MITVSIHQPNFFPWLGYFDKINRSEKFIFLTSSLRSKNDKYLTRTKILNNNSKPQYLSIPLGSQQILINQLMMPTDYKWKLKTLNIIKESYRNSYYFDEIYNDIEELLKHEHDYFVGFSINIIKFFILKLNIDTEIYVDNDFDQSFGESNQRNVKLCKIVGGNIYLSGNGAKVYNDHSFFKDNSLDLIYQDYIPPTYKQNSHKFIPGLSIIDVIFNCGYKVTENLIK
jgi:hypothetical protein